MTDLVSHLESYLGPMSGGSRGDEATPDGVQVVWFDPGSPFPGARTVSTLGLSRSHLEQPPGRSLHQELLMHFRADDLPSTAAGVLFQLAGELIARGRGLLRGDVVGPRGRVFGRGHATALYVALPVYLPDGFAAYREANRTIVLTWLVPITDGEAEFVERQGWPAFESLLVANDPDLTDIGRASIV